MKLSPQALVLEADSDQVDAVCIRAVTKGPARGPSCPANTDVVFVGDSDV